MSTADWPAVRLSDVATIVMGQSPPGSTYNEDGIGLPFFQGVRDFNYRHPTPRVYCSEPSRVAQADDILLSVRAPIGRVNVADRECATGRGVAIIKPNAESDARYLEFALRSLERSWDSIEGSGSVFGNATKRDLESLVLPWPDSASERGRIAGVLGGLDDKIELNRRMGRTLEQVARALFRSWFVDFEPVRAKQAQRWSPGQSLPGLPAQLHPLFPDQLEPSPQGPIPQGWRVATLGDVVEVAGGGTPSTKRAEFWDGGEHCWATPRDLASLTSPVLLETERRITDAGLARISSGLLPSGTLLLSSRAPVGYLAITAVPVAINQGFIAINGKEGMSNLFMLHWCEAFREQIMNYANGSTFLEISKASFRQIPVVVPPPPVVAAFEQHALPLNATLRTSAVDAQRLMSIRDASLAAFFASAQNPGNIR